jgi:hypothetical protein
MAYMMLLVWASIAVPCGVAILIAKLCGVDF